jgi:predicted nucleic acid-binding protein
VTLVVDSCVALKWVLGEPDSHLAQALAESEEELLTPDFWLNEATNVCGLQVLKRVRTPDEAREGPALLRDLVPPPPTGDFDPHDVALDIGLAVSHSTCAPRYVAFAVATGARGVVVADGPFPATMSRHPDPALAAIVIPLAKWERGRGDS